MAYTKIHAVKATIHKAVKYICDESKTDEKILIFSYGCSPETAEYDFKAALSKTSSIDSILAHHLIQSFAPGETTPDVAHEIGKELADGLLKGKHAYILATHINKKHIHNHIIFCAAEIERNRKFHSCKSSYRQIRYLSDQLCQDYGLSVIRPQKGKSKSYQQWSKNHLIDTSKDSIAANVRLKKWAEKQNLKLAASSYSDAHSIAELKEVIAHHSQLLQESKQQLLSIKNEIRELKEIIKYAQQYNKNLRYNKCYKNAKDPDTYFRNHDAQLMLFNGAEHYLQTHGIDTSSINIQKLTSQLDNLRQMHNTMTEAHNNQRDIHKNLVEKMNTINQYLDRNLPTQSRETERPL